MRLQQQFIPLSLLKVVEPDGLRTNLLLRLGCYSPQPATGLRSHSGTSCFWSVPFLV